MKSVVIIRFKYTLKIYKLRDKKIRNFAFLQKMAFLSEIRQYAPLFS